MRIICCLVFSTAFLQLSVLATKLSEPRQQEVRRVAGRVARRPRLVDNDQTKPESDEAAYHKRHARRAAEERLLNNLYMSYNDDVSPGEPTKVTFGISYQCANYDEKSRILTSTAWLRFSWNDERLIWNSADYENIQALRVPGYRLWTPDIKLYNAIEPIQMDWTHAVVYSSGDVTWINPVNFKTYCSPNKDGTAQCDLKFGSWTYDGEKMPLISPENDEAKILDMTSYNSAGCPNKITKPTARVDSMVYDCCPEHYDSINLILNVVKNI